jgi:MarR family transcriptional regulator, multiple gene regulator MgrA
MPPIEEEIRQTTFRNDRHKTIINLVYTANWLSGKHTQFLKEFGISEQQFNILRILRGQQPNLASITLLKERMLDKMSDVSRLVERLRVAGLVQRDLCERDRRAVEVGITPKGLKLLATIDKRTDEVDNALARLDCHEIAFLNYLLDKIRTENNTPKK